MIDRSYLYASSQRHRRCSIRKREEGGGGKKKKKEKARGGESVNDCSDGGELTVQPCSRGKMIFKEVFFSVLFPR